MNSYELAADQNNHVILKTQIQTPLPRIEKPPCARILLKDRKKQINQNENAGWLQL